MDQRSRSSEFFFASRPAGRFSNAFLAVLLAVSFAVLFGGACASTDKEPKARWHDASIESSTDRILWQVALRACDKMAFPIRASLDPSSMVIETGWRTNLQPFRGEGTREKAELRMTPVAPGKWQVKARVKRQVNMALARPLDPRYAEWKWSEDDDVQARLLVQHVRAYLDPSIELVDRPDDPVEALLEQHGLSDR